MRPMDVVRARHKDTGDHYTTTRHLATQRGDEILENRPAIDTYGRWLPTTPRKNLEPARDSHGRFTTHEPHAGEEEA